MKIFAFVLLSSILHVRGVSGDKVKPVFATEGDSVTLHTYVTVIQSDDMILWSFGPDNTVIVRDSVIKFTDRIKLDGSTGSLTINNITADFSGIYKLHDVRKSSYRSIFNVSVYARLPVPVISRNSSQCSSSSCSVVCSVVNVSRVTLSWLKGNSLLSSISVSDLSISLSLPLEVEGQEKNTYSCEIHNPIRHQTTRLDISQHCQQCHGWIAHHVILVCCALAVAATVILFGIYCYSKWKKSKQANKGKPDEEEMCKWRRPHNSQRMDADRPDAVEMSMLKRDSQIRSPGILEMNSFIGDTLRRISEIDGVETNSFGDCSQYSKYNETNSRCSTLKSKHMETNSLGACSSRSMYISRDEMRSISVNVGEYLNLETGIGYIEEDEIIEWRFAISNESRQTFFVIAEWNERQKEGLLYNEGVFKGRLLLDENTGSLTIRNVTQEHSGQYKLHITDERQNMSMILFNVTVY